MKFKKKNLTYFICFLCYILRRHYQNIFTNINLTKQQVYMFFIYMCIQIKTKKYNE